MFRTIFPSSNSNSKYCKKCKGNDINIKSPVQNVFISTLNMGSCYIIILAFAKYTCSMHLPLSREQN